MEHEVGRYSHITPAFNNALDGLITVDLRDVQEKTLARYMGREQTHEYLTYHANSNHK
ncbi:hypothetical protein [Vibrio rotiferianus]|uniref:hypothetical protein n=1 Tax=Vibrio rotiferianus TaxID=190895 RepID=UPI001485E405|nr:hypothetical protein [Vibrio rotiferianus]